MMMSIVSPVYKAQRTIPVLIERIELALSGLGLDYEIILVDDGCPENSWSTIEQVCQQNKSVIGLKLSRNFGQHHAITAGLDKSRGDWVVVMDCDLQDRPEEIPILLKKALEGFDIVLARRNNRQDSIIKKMQSKLFYKVYTYLSGVKHDGTVANFGIYSSKVIKTINSMREPMRAFPPMIQWVGFNHTTVDVVHACREDGKSTYTISKLINLALDIAISYSDKPMRLTIKTGLFISVSSIFFSLFTLVKYLRGQIVVEGYASLIISVWFLSGLSIFFLGIIGLYIGKIFDGIKNRPLYIITKQLNE